MTGQQMDVTRAGLDWRRSQTHLTLDTRSVPRNIHNMSHRQSARDQVNASHNQSHQNVSLSQESSVNDTLRVKRHNRQLHWGMLLFGYLLLYKISPTTFIILVLMPIMIN